MCDACVVFERFTERARQAVVLAQEEARRLKHNYIGTEHILLGLLREQEGVAARVLASLHITVELVRGQIVRMVGSGDAVTSGQIPFTPRAQTVLRLAQREAVSLGHGYVGTEHILLGIVGENEGVAARILLDFGADPDTTRNEVNRMLAVAPHSFPTSPTSTGHEMLGRPTHSGSLLGWRARSIVLAALGAVSLSRRAFSARSLDELDPLAGRLLVAIALMQSPDDAEAREHGSARSELRALALCDDDELDAATDVLITAGLIELRPPNTWLDPDDEDERLALTEAGIAAVESWLRHVAPLFTGWPPDQHDVDDAQ